MIKRPRLLEVTPALPGGDRRRGQSDVIAIVLLIGMIFLGAIAVIVAGGALVDSVQENSQHELALDSAAQTHQQISEALQSGEPRELSVTDAVDMRVRDSGSLSIEMRNSTGAACSANDPRVDAIDTDLGAIVYDTPRGQVIYEGGAIWERTDGGFSAERTPPISYDGDTARISVQTVSADADDFEGEIARPDEQVQETMARNTTRMLRHCPPRSFTEIQISVTSPYHELWNAHFQESVATDPGNVTVTHNPASETVTANISNATSPHASRGLRFDDVTAPSVVGPPSMNLADNFTVGVTVANDGFSTRNASVELEIDGIGSETTDELSVPPSGTGTVSRTFDGGRFTPSSFQYGHLTSPGGHDLDTNELHEYTLRLNDGYGNVVSETTGKFFLANSSGDLHLAGTDETLDAPHDSLMVNATLVNTQLTAQDTDVTFNITDDRVDMSAVTEPDVNVSKHGGLAEVSFGVNVSTLPAGLYEYRVEASGADGSPRPDHFAIVNRTQSNLVGQLLVESIDAPTMVATDSSFSPNVGVLNLGENPASGGTLELDVEGLSPVTTDVTGLPPYSSVNESPTVDQANLSTLQAGRVHNYTVTLHSGVESTSAMNGSFYLGEPGPAPYVEDINHSDNVDGNMTINATVGNHGMENVSRNVALTLADGDGNSFGPATQHVDLPPGASVNVSFEFDASEIAGVYNYTVEFGNQSTASIDFGGVDSGDDGVSIKAPGNGSVTVLGTEVSGESTSSPWRKQWAPIGVTVIEERNGVQQEHPYVNDETELDLANDRNLNTYDTQFHEWQWNWTQDANETMNLTLSSTYWSRTDHLPDYGTDCPSYDRGEDHTRNGPGYDEDRTYTDYHPIPEMYQNVSTFWGDPHCEANSLTVDATAGEHPNNVRVLTNGDELPDITRGFPDQRNASQVLNQGAANRIDPDTGELLLNSNEAVFLFELTDEDATWEDAQDAPPNSDPTYNDVIAIVEFTPADPDISVNFSITDGNTLTIGPTGDPDSGANNGNQSIGSPDPSVDEDGDTGPTAPDPQSPDPGTPSQPDEIDVDVGGVVIG